MSAPVERVGPAAFDGERLLRPGIVAVAFVADWCPFCREFLPTFEGLVGRIPAALLIGDVTDLNSPLWETFHVEIVPTVVLFRDGKPIRRADGVAGEGVHAAELEAVVAAAKEAAASHGQRDSGAVRRG